MNRRAFVTCFTFPIILGCRRETYSGFIVLQEEGTHVRLDIPLNFFLKNSPRKTASSVWIQLSYPEMNPVETTDRGPDTIALLILNIANRRTRAEYFYATKGDVSGRNSELEANEFEFNVRESAPNKQGVAEITTYSFSRTAEKYVISYEINAGFKINFSRRYSNLLELRYIIPQNIYHDRKKIDSAIASLLDTFTDKS